MGFLSNMLRGRSPIDQHIMQTYVPQLQRFGGFSPSDADRMLREIIRDAKRDSSREGTNRLPSDIAEQRLQSPTAAMQLKRSAGVRDEDFRWWYGMQDVERRVLLKLDDVNQLAAFLKFQDSGLSESEAARKVWKYTAMYGDLEDTSHASGDDRPLPIELKGRVGLWFQSRFEQSPAAFTRKMEASTSLNALIRREIRRGKL